QWSRWAVQRARLTEKIVAVVIQERPTFPARRENRSSGNARPFNVPGSMRKPFKWSRKSVQRARFGEKIVQEVTLGRSTCPAQRENRLRGNAGPFNVPGSVRNSLQWSRKSVHRAQLSEKIVAVVTQERPSCPVQREIRSSGHVREFIVSSQA